MINNVPYIILKQTLSAYPGYLIIMYSILINQS